MKTFADDYIKKDTPLRGKKMLLVLMEGDVLFNFPNKLALWKKYMAMKAQIVVAGDRAYTDQHKKFRQSFDDYCLRTWVFFTYFVWMDLYSICVVVEIVIPMVTTRL